MKSTLTHIAYKVLLGTSLLFLLCSAFYSVAPPKNIFKTPKGWPTPVYPVDSLPVTQDGFILGRTLFFDPILSRDSTISCAHCHLPHTAFSHTDHSISHGIDNRQGIRSSLALMNLAWNKSFMWDGSVKDLHMQPIVPIENPAEMDEKFPRVLTKLNKSPMYRVAFQKAYGTRTIESQHLLRALTDFTLMLVSADSKYDRVMRKEKGLRFTPEEKQGLKLFRKQCESCHREPLFTNQNFETNGLELDPYLKDYGRMRVTKKREDSLKFRVPTLRNIEYTEPYMHDGRFSTLQKVLDHYSEGLDRSSNKSPKLPEGFHFSTEEKRQLLAFLKTLSDEKFVTDKRFRYGGK